jgi:hypothetical protein
MYLLVLTLPTSISSLIALAAAAAVALFFRGDHVHQDYAASHFSFRDVNVPFEEREKTMGPALIAANNVVH